MLRDTGNFNIVSSNWLLDMSDKTQLQLKRRDMICMTPQMNEQFKDSYDECGDSYSDFVDEQELTKILADLEGSEV